MKTKTLYIKDAERYRLDMFPNFHKSGSIIGMKKIYGKDCMLVRCGSYIFNVDSFPPIYHYAH